MEIKCKDNLEFMQGLQNESIDLIYCDILYGTGRNFGDYQDLKADRKMIEDFYLPRIIEMHRVLKSTGSIYLHIDCKIQHWIRCIMDDILGIEKFRNEIIWGYDWGGRGEKTWAKKHDNILFYTKSNKWTFNTDEVRVPYKTQIEGRKNPLVSKEKFNRGKLPTDVWDISVIHAMSKERVGYPTQKPEALLERIIKASSNEGDTVADFFLGSGTTAVVCKELNRKFIGCDINERAIKITNERLNAKLL
jgi:DNA modification methylase